MTDAADDSAPNDGVANGGAPDDGRRDFDFLFGRWRVHNRLLLNMFDPDCAEWIEYDMTCEARPILGGLGNVDSIAGERPGFGPFEGFTLRLFDPGRRLWRIWWASTKFPGVLDVPVEGRFDGTDGEFNAEDVLDGRPALVRFGWTASADRPRWQQWFSWDAGTTWQHNWIMDFERVS